MWKSAFILFFATCSVHGEETARDNADIRREFFDIIKKTQFVAVLFSEPCCTCTECVEAEALLAALNPALEDSFGILTVKLTAQGDIAESYGVTRRPTLLFLRSQQPVLYDGKFEPEEIKEWLSNSKEPYVKQLDDDTFEHLTQAATGATTGDWLVTFFDSSCKHRMALSAVLDSVALRLKRRSNVALVNSDQSPETKERFSISKCPTTIFFRLGKLYRYNLPSFSPGSLRSFAEGFYKNAKSFPVPKVLSPFDKLVDKSVTYLKMNSWIPLIVLLLTLGICGIFFASTRKQKIEKRE